MNEEKPSHTLPIHTPESFGDPLTNAGLQRDPLAKVGVQRDPLTNAGVQRDPGTKVGVNLLAAGQSGESQRAAAPAPLLGATLVDVFSEAKPADPGRSRPGVTRLAALNGANVIALEFLPGQKMPDHKAAHPILLQVLRGEIQITVQGPTVGVAVNQPPTLGDSMALHPMAPASTPGDEASKSQDLVGGPVDETHLVLRAGQVLHIDALVVHALWLDDAADPATVLLTMLTGEDVN